MMTIWFFIWVINETPTIYHNNGDLNSWGGWLIACFVLSILNITNRS
jgi:hypothetical protein